MSDRIRAVRGGGAIKTTSRIEAGIAGACPPFSAEDIGRSLSASAAESKTAGRAAGLFRDDPSVLGDRIVALSLAVMALPLFLLVATLVRVTSGRPVLYRGERLGKDKQPFTIYKFRTLKADAETRLDGRLVSDEHELTTAVGRWLRHCRLDELPQLINVVLGDMRLFGARPERRKVYEAKCRGLPEYENRFAGRPGLIGTGQLFTPHATPKGIRTRIENRLASVQDGAAGNMLLLARTGVSMPVSAVCFLWDAARAGWAIRGIDRFVRRRLNSAIRPADASAILSARNGSASASDRADVLVMNQSHMLITADSPIAETFVEEAELEIVLPPRKHGPRRRRVKGRATIIASSARCGGTGSISLIRFKAATPYQEYVLNQYFLNGSFIRRV